jgi:probable rRNA maturation factor
VRSRGKIRISGRQKLLKLNRVGLRRDVRLILELLGVGERELSLTFVDDAQIQTINRDYLGKDRPTNVISFSLSEGAFGDVNPGMLGDVVVSVETASRESRAAGIPVGDAVLNLILHGILHLTGFDHAKGSGRARVMSAVQEAIFFEIRGYRLALKL